jgi:hypothetical protein
VATRAIEVATRAIEVATRAIEVATRAIEVATRAIGVATRADEVAARGTCRLEQPAGSLVKGGSLGVCSVPRPVTAGPCPSLWPDLVTLAPRR